jgi:hypothetical protein
MVPLNTVAQLRASIVGGSGRGEPSSGTEDRAMQPPHDVL